MHPPTKKIVDPAVSEAARALVRRSWDATPDRKARTAPATAARLAKAARAKAERERTGADDDR